MPRPSSRGRGGTEEHGAQGGRPEFPPTPFTVKLKNPILCLICVFPGGNQKRRIIRAEGELEDTGVRGAFTSSSGNGERGEEPLPHAGLLARWWRGHGGGARPTAAVGQPKAPALRQSAAARRRGRRHRGRREGGNWPAARRRRGSNSSCAAPPNWPCPSPRPQWSPSWEGPLRVVRVVPGNAYMLEYLNGEELPKALNGRFLKRYYPSVWQNA